MCETLDLISLCDRGRPHFIRFCFQLFQRLQEFSQAMQSRLGRDFAAISRFLLWVALLSTFSPSTTSRVYIAAERNVPRRRWCHSFYIWKELMNQPSLSSHFQAHTSTEYGEGTRKVLTIPDSLSTFIFIIPPHNNQLYKQI